MQSYINHFQQPPPNTLVTRKLESENTYDEGAWSDHHWEDTMAKQVEITDSPNISNVFDDTFVKKTPTTTINSTLSASKLDFHNGLQAVNPCNIDEEIEYINQDTMYYKDLNSTNESVQNEMMIKFLKILKPLFQDSVKNILPWCQEEPSDQN